MGDPSADLTITFPDSLESNAGTVVTTGNLAAITKTGAVTSGSLASGFGVIDIGSDISTSGTLTTAALAATASLDIGPHGFRASTLTADAQTSGRVAVYGTDGVLSETADLTMVGDTLTATKLGAFEATGAIDFGSQAMTNVDICLLYTSPSPRDQ